MILDHENKSQDQLIVFAQSLLNFTRDLLTTKRGNIYFGSKVQGQLWPKLQEKCLALQSSCQGHNGYNLVDMDKLLSISKSKLAHIVHGKRMNLTDFQGERPRS